MGVEEHPNVALIRESFDAMGRGDMAWMQDHVSDDIVWHVGGNNKMTGAYKGKEQIAQMFGGVQDTMGDDAGGFVHDVVGNADHVVAMGTANLKAPDGDTVEYRYVNVFHVKDGKITEVWGMAEDDSVTDPFFDKLAQ
jgi:ketosteroid isomerase-like protein